MAETERRSTLYALEPLIKRWPAVTKPEGHVSFKTKLLWTTVCLLLYFMLSNIPLYGVSRSQLDIFAGFRAILAGQSGSLMHLGIGPIVTGSIVMQLFTGAKIIKLDLTKDEDKAIYQGAQKIMVLLFIFIEAIPQVFGFLNPDQLLVNRVGGFGAASIVVAQLALGAIIVFLMDELISKWGIGSGISLFIAAGVSQSLFQGTLSIQQANVQGGGGHLNPFNNPPVGAVPMFFYVFYSRDLNSLVRGNSGSASGFEQVFIGGPNFPNPLIAFFGTIAIFMFVVYAEASPIAGGAWYLQQFRGLSDWFLPLFDPRYSAYAHGHVWWQILIKVAVFMGLFIGGSIMFAKFWVDTTNMGPRDVAKQIEKSGMQIPGFRRDPRVLEKVLERYIPTLTVIGGATVGALAAFADMIGTVGQASGTGLLLCVGIFMRMYEQIAKEQVMEMHPVLRGFFGAE
ncbi:MAG: preprotein translocase subunit SecY [Halobacteriales archaeon]|nr:preprotein translocase subunit SecY [Halobacteriales archaeon]